MHPATPALLTDRVLKIPYALAAAYARPDTQAYDELVSMGNLALTLALNKYDPTKGTKLSTWVITYVKKYLHHRRHCPHGERHQKRWDRLTSLDAEDVPGSGKRLLDVIAYDADDKSAELQEHAERILKCLKPMNRAIYVLRYARGMKLDEIAEACGVTHHSTVGRLRASQKQLKRFLAAYNRDRSSRDVSGLTPGGTPPHNDRQRQASARAVRERSAANRLIGQIPAGKELWYLAHDGRKVLLGPSKRLRSLAVVLGVDLPKQCGKAMLRRISEHPALAGWRALRGPEARRLAEYEGYRLSG